MALSPSNGHAQQPSKQPPCKVLRIIDGDTFECLFGAIRQSVRLLGIDAPEAKQRPYGAKATAALKRLLHLRSDVILELDVRERDSHGRLLAFVWNDQGTMVNEEMLEQGFALVYIEPPNVMYDSDLRAAEKRARAKRTGLWATDAFSCTPVNFRRKLCA